MAPIDVRFRSVSRICNAGRFTLFGAVLDVTELQMLLTPFDLKRLDSYANNALDYHVVLDLVPTIGALYFDRRLGPEVRLSAVQSAILLGLGLQRKSIEDIEVCMPVISTNGACDFLTSSSVLLFYRKKSEFP